MTVKLWYQWENVRPDNKRFVIAIGPDGIERVYWVERGLLFFEDKSMHTYFDPTFWRYKED